jgi:hypothetical protein
MTHELTRQTLEHLSGGRVRQMPEKAPRRPTIDPREILKATTLAGRNTIVPPQHGQPPIDWTLEDQ